MNKHNSRAQLVNLLLIKEEEYANSSYMQHTKRFPLIIKKNKLKHLKKNPHIFLSILH